ncbi:PTH2-domain-containing protein [Saitoella complicata NRRL Y-17804]|uniref:PTH2-domain-containing protein n=1 Tax=Saitoella complicata (strain BCRC 22490 / CBS 7301 / JCM 7358 / NBRC 10748 / NRRL Y-17804) TaxID=698492 RepID=UPI000867E6A9|nr:PTH2-domain-containing protein [Saitoella complicata NRRL Y-17804]ODQ56404.1 PTH2-domain-containing protein [Saitoella complicata NRRL Y-17804]
MSMPNPQATHVPSSPALVPSVIATAVLCLAVGYYVGLGSSLGVSSSNNTSEEAKLVLVVRTDLGMTKGKIAAQCSHATLACYKSLLRHNPALLQHWESAGQPKITLQTKDEEEMLVMQAKALSLGLVARVVRDAGRTQIPAGSATVLGVGPGPRSVVDEVTGHLRLY